MTRIHPQCALTPPLHSQDHLVLETLPPFRIILYWTTLPFDLLCHVAYNAPLRTRRERAQALRRERKDFFDQYGPDARTVLNDILDKYVEYGTAQFQIPAILKVPPISERGTVIDIAQMFGGAEQLRDAVAKVQTYLYAA